MKQRWPLFAGFAAIIVALFLANLFCGSVSIPARAVVDIIFGREVEKSVWASIILQSRMPQAITAILAGMALSTCGLLLQTLFRNPLAGPSILGVSNGANMGVAIVFLLTGGYMLPGLTGQLSVTLAALIGALAVLALILYLSLRLRSNELVLILGIIIGYLASSGISILNSMASADNIRAFVLWGMGSFSGVSNNHLPFYTATILIGLACAALLVKPLNALMLGDNYAANLGVNINRTRIAVLLTTGLLTAIVTAWCGPITFIGLSVPHIARLLIGTSNQKILLPAAILTGAFVALLCNLLTIVPITRNLLPLNAVTPIIGAPVIVWVIMKKNRHF